MLLHATHAIETIEGFRGDIFTDILVASKKVLHAVETLEVGGKHALLKIYLLIQPGLEDFTLGLAGNLRRQYMEVKPISKRHLFHNKFELPVQQRRTYSNQSNVGAFERIRAQILYLSGFSRTFVGVVVIIAGICWF